MEYFILKPDGEQTGTFSLEQIRAMLNSGFITTGSRYWHEGIVDWQPIERIEESINYPEPDPHQLHAPPSPQKWTGSLARAIPSPTQLRQKSGPVALTNTPVFAEVPATPTMPTVPAPLRPAAEIPASTLRVESTPASNGAYEPTAPAISRERAVAEAPRIEPREPFRLPRIPMPNATQVCALGLVLLVAAIIAAIVASRHPAKSAFSEVTVTLHNDCVLTDQKAIRSFGQDMRDQRHSISIARLKDLVAKSTDPAFIQTAGISLQQAILKYETGVTRDYVQDGKAEIIEPGTYHTVAFFDDSGNLIVAHAGAAWAAILYKGAVVYAYLGADYEARAE